eukprot:gene11205-7778_t
MARLCFSILNTEEKTRNIYIYIYIFLIVFVWYFSRNKGNNRVRIAHTMLFYLMYLVCDPLPPTGVNEKETKNKFGPKFDIRTTGRTAFFFSHKGRGERSDSNNEKKYQKYLLTIEGSGEKQEEEALKNENQLSYG